MLKVMTKQLSLNGDVDAAAVFNDARNTVKKDQPNVFKDTRILKLTQAIPNDTISVDQIWIKIFKKN